MISARHIKAWEKFNSDLSAFAQETEQADTATLDKIQDGELEDTED
jgi:phage-related protein